MTSKSRAIDVRLKTIERALLNAEARRSWALGREEAGEAGASATVLAIHERIRELVDQATRIRPVSLIGLAAKARIAGRHHDLVSAGRAVFRSLVEDLHALEPLRRR